MKRVSFVLGASSCGLIVPRLAQADAAHGEHVHGANGVTSIPEHVQIAWEMEVLDGPRFRLADYRGKALFVNVFATWCGPCNEEQPELVAFARAHADDTAVVGLDLGEEDNAVRAYRKKYAIPYPIAMHRDRYSVPTIFHDRIAYPTTIVFHPNGTLSCAWQDRVDRQWLEAERAYALAVEAAPEPAAS